MVDTLTKEDRSKLMAKIRSNNTGPEKMVRRMLYTAGIGYRLHSPKLPGSPDIIMKGRKTVIFVHGCFWHQHNCRIASVPKSHTEFWMNKFKRNKERDQENQKELLEMGWRVLIVWECSLRKKDLLNTREQILDWIHSDESYGQISGTIEKAYLPVMYGSFEALLKEQSL